MPPTFAYAMCLILYLMAMGIGLAICAVLLLFPSRRRMALRLAAAVVASLPGVLLFHLVVAVPLGILLGAVLGSYALFETSDSVRWAIGIPTIVVMFVSVVVASIFGCYTGARLAWYATGAASFRAAVTADPVFRFMSRLRRLRKRN